MVAFLDHFCEPVCRVGANQVDRASAETCTGHPRSQNSRLLQRQLHQNVKLLAAHFVVIAQALMGSNHQLAEAFEVPFFQILDGLEHTIVLSHHMPRPLQEDLTQAMACNFQVGQVDLAKRLDGQPGGSKLRYGLAALPQPDFIL